jgi:predicted glutamine amidotransferase
MVIPLPGISMQPKLPPPDPYESLGMGPLEGRRMSAPAAVFVMGPPSPEVDRVSDAILDLGPGVLIVLAPDGAAPSGRGGSAVCRWLAYSGSPILLQEALYAPAHSLIEQSLHSRLGAETTNGDGFGVGWYGDQPTPGVFHSVEPAWNDRNLQELSAHVSSGHFFAHIRAATGTAVQQTNCHPYRHGRWLWMHNGMIRDFAKVKRDLVLAVDESLFPEIEGQTDSEVLFFLALSFGLEEDPIRAVEHAVGLVEAAGERHGVEHPFQGTIASTDGERMWVFRYSSEGRSRSLFFTTDVPTLRMLYPERQLFQEVSDDARVVVSEPLGSVAGVWNEVPESTCGVVGKPHDELLPFRPKPPPEVRWDSSARDPLSRRAT